MFDVLEKGTNIFGWVDQVLELRIFVLGGSAVFLNGGLSARGDLLSEFAKTLIVNPIQSLREGDNFSKKCSEIFAG